MLDQQLAAFARRRLEEPYPYLIPDAHYEKAWVDRVIRSQAVLVAVVEASVREGQFVSAASGSPLSFSSMSARLWRKR